MATRREREDERSQFTKDTDEFARYMPRDFAVRAAQEFGNVRTRDGKSYLNQWIAVVRQVRAGDKRLSRRRVSDTIKRRAEALYIARITSRRGQRRGRRGGGGGAPRRWYEFYDRLKEVELREVA